MHRYKTIAQTLLVLSILNLVDAAPLLSQGVRNTARDLVVGTEDMTTVSDRRRGEQPPGETTPQDPPSLPEGSPPHGSSTADHVTLLDGSRLSSDSHWSEGEGRVPVLDPITGVSTSTHPLSTVVEPPPAPAPVPNTESSTSSPATNRPGSALDSTAAAEATTPRPQYLAVTHDMLGKQPPSKKEVALRRIAGLTLIGGVFGSIILFSELYNKKD